MSKLMEKEVRNAAVKGDLTIFSNKNHELLLKKTYKNDNIIHIAAQHKQFDFIIGALNSFPSSPTCESLLRDQNCDRDTPLHIMAQVGEVTVMEQLYEFFLTRCGDSTGGSDRVFPWRMVNSDGNTPAHVALLYGNDSVAKYLVEKDGYVARITNDSKETLLHLVIQYHAYGNPNDSETEATSWSKENVLPIVELLLKIESSLACWANTDGSTALHQAASLNPTYCIPVILAMLASSPEAAAVKDERSKHTILHLLTNHKVTSYKQGIELMQIPEVNALINIKDNQGDTPLHLAVRNHDSIMVRVLLEFSPKLDLTNKSGVSLRSLHPQLEKMRSKATPVEQRRKLTDEDCEAAKRGDVAFLNEKLDSLGMDFLVSQTPREGTILHALMEFYGEHNNVDPREFTRKAIQILPSLITQQDHNGNTLLHLILDKEILWPDVIQSNLLMLVQKDGLYRLKNKKGETPLHVAVRTRRYDYAIDLLKVDSEVAGYVNNRNQTALHLLPYQNGGGFYLGQVEELINGLINGNADIAYMQDEDGLTPLLTAVREYDLGMTKILLEQFPASGEIADFKGRTFWHWFGHRHGEADAEDSDAENYKICQQWMLSIIEDGHMKRLMGNKDNDGNTPLHLAIENQQFCFAHFFLRYSKGSYEELLERSLATENKKGVSCYDLIGSAEHLHPQFVKFLSKRGFLSLKGNLLSGRRSLYGVPTTKIEAYANTMGVIAALLATITFTAAFAVPGGLDSSNGTPLLLQHAAFQVFMVADVVAMCSSMMVLFCLLWIITTGNKRESILLLDVSVLLLQTSFYATIVTFMTGLYVTTISIVPAIAISTCVICTLLIILMNKSLVMLTVVPFGMFIILIPDLIRFAGEYLLFVWLLLNESERIKYANAQLSKLWSLISKPKCLRSSQNTEAEAEAAEMSSEVSVPSKAAEMLSKLRFTNTFERRSL